MFSHGRAEGFRVDEQSPDSACPLNKAISV